MKKHTSLVLVLFSALSINAATVTQGRTDIFYDCTNNVVHAVQTVDEDYNTQYYYTTQVNMGLRKDNLIQAGAEWGYNTGEVGATTLYAQTPGVAGSVFDVITWYYNVIEYQTYEVISCPGCYDWYDIYGYWNIAQSGDPESEGPTFSVWVWAAPIIVVRTVDQIIGLGNGGAKTELPGGRDIFDVTVRSFIPKQWVWSPSPDLCSSGGIVRYVLYHGDGRTYNPYTFDVRTHSGVFLQTSTGSYVANTKYNYTGLSKRYASDALQPDGSLIEDSVLHDCHWLDDRGYASIANMHIDVSGNAATRTATGHFYGGAGNPLALPGTPEISWNATISISSSNPTFPSYTLTFSHDCFPAYEFYIGRQRIHGYMPSSYNEYTTIPYCLGGGGQILDSTIGVVF